MEEFCENNSSGQNEIQKNPYKTIFLRGKNENTNCVIKSEIKIEPDDDPPEIIPPLELNIKCKIEEPEHMENHGIPIIRNNNSDIIENKPELTSINSNIQSSFVVHIKCENEEQFENELEQKINDEDPLDVRNCKSGYVSKNNKCDLCDKIFSTPYTLKLSLIHI